MTTSSHDPRVSAQLDTLLQATHQLISALADAAVTEPLLTTAITALSSLTQARYGAIAITCGDAGIEHFITYGMTEAQRHLIGALPTGETGLLAKTLYSSKAIRLDDIGSSPDAGGFPDAHPPDVRTAGGAHHHRQPALRPDIPLRQGERRPLQ